MALKYKVGNKVRIKSIDWYNENKDEYGDVDCGNKVFDNYMSVFCGSVVTIDGLYPYTGYDIREDRLCRTWTDEMIEGLAEEIEITQDTKTFSEGYDQGYENGQHDMNEWVLPEGFEFRDENGNVINATKIILEKKKKYPKTYEECIGKLPINWDGKAEGYKSELLNNFQKLLICRDVYWKIAGEEIGLGKPWEPDWKDGSIKNVILYDHNEINADFFNCTANRILSFPTEEMRDAFYKNFKELIAECKELL